MTTKEKYDLWVDKVCAYIEEVGPTVKAPSCTMQSAPVLDKQPRVLFLGHDAREPYDFEGANRDRFYTGNNTFIPYRHKWTIWNRTEKAFRSVEADEFVTDGNFMFMNLFYFGGNNIDKANEAMKGDVMRQCIDFTDELVHDIIKPRLIVCFSVNMVFNYLAPKMEQVERVQLPIQQTVKRGMWNGIPVIGIPHPSARGLSRHYWATVTNYIKHYNNE